ncbi:lipoyl protein ligase domain-containing protein [Amphritea sp.]|uniref:lipoyl protein ligase domain-containing protein n=1 Tax=Amphritea sp. TaxID=1872502 RepID=UPI003A8DAC62
MDNNFQSMVIGSMPDEQQRISEVLEAGVEEPQVLLWQYDQAAVILGCSQRPDTGQLSRAENAGLPLVRRRSGGGAVLAGPWMLSVTVFIPPEHSLAKQNIIEIFSWLEAIWIDTLTACGVPCKGVDQAMIEQSKTVSQEKDLKWACYASLSHGEVVSLDGRKLVGLAQIRKRKGVALVSGLHLSPCDWQLLSSIVVDNPLRGESLADLNSDVQSLSGIAAEQLLPSLIHTFTTQINAAFE